MISRNDPKSAAATLRPLGAGRVSQPVDVDRIAQQLKCSVREANLSTSRRIEAELRPSRTNDAFTITVDPRPPAGPDRAVSARLSRRRRRFRVAHEIGHSLFFERDRARAPRRRVPWREDEERFCDEFARSLLVPPEAAAAAPASPRSAIRLSDRFDVSLEVGVRALDTAHPASFWALLYWHPDDPAAADSLIKQWASQGVENLHEWRASDLVAKAISAGSEARGEVGDPIGGRVPVRAEALADLRRRQVIVVVTR